jgi:hypothetical protein
MEGAVKIPDEEAACVVFVCAPLVASSYQVVRHVVPGERVATSTRDFDVAVSELLFDAIRDEGGILAFVVFAGMQVVAAKAAQLLL